MANKRWLVWCLLLVLLVAAAIGLWPLWQRGLQQGARMPKNTTAQEIRGQVPKPQRIVSLNLCIDQMLLLLVEPSRIAALSRLAKDSHLSVLADQARMLPQTMGSAEEVLALQPDLVLVGSFTTQHTTDMLRHFGIPIAVIPLADGWDKSIEQLELIARFTGDTDKAQQLVQHMRARAALMQQEHPVTEQSPVAALYGANGYTAGTHTLFNDLLALSGWRNAAAMAGQKGYGSLPLEQLVALRPQLLVADEENRRKVGQSWQSLHHPVLKHSVADWLSMPSRLTICGGPWSLDAAQMLADRVPASH